jgi:hypothetical protein
MKESVSRSSFLLLVLACLVGATVVRAQQAGDPDSAGTYSPLANVSSNGTSLPSGVFPSSTSALAGGVAQGGAIQAGTANSTSANEKFTRESGSRSAWLAGSSNVGASRTGGWRNGAGIFTHTGASWTAGGSSFRPDRQAGGIWRVNMTSGLPSSAISPSTDLLSLPGPAPGFSTGLTSKGAAMIKAARISSPFASQGAGSPSRAQSSLGTAATPFTSPAGSLGASGSGAGATSPQQGPGSEMPTDPSLNDSFEPDSGKDLSGSSR